MGGSSKKESNRADDLARQERTRAAEQAAALRAQQEAAAAQLRQELQTLTQLNPFEQANQASITGLRPQVESMYSQSAAGGPALNTPLGLALQERLLSDLNRQPDDLFAPNLELLKGQVGQFAARRGIVGSGLELEQLGRTGVEMAIQQAQAREQIRAADTSRALAGNQSLETIGAGRRSELGGYYQNLQSLEDARRAREIGAVSGGAQQGAQLRSQGNLTALERLNQGDVRAGQYDTDQLNADRAARASQQSAIGKGIGTVAALGLAPFTGGASLLAVPGMWGGGGGNPLALMQQPAVQTTQPGAGQMRAAQRNPRGLEGGYLDFYERYNR